MDSYTDVRGQCCGSGRRSWETHHGLAESGADAKHAIEEGLVSVNGETAYQRGKKLVDGDTISYRGQVVKIEKP